MGNIKITDEKEISSNDFFEKYEETIDKVRKNGLCFILKDGKPDAVIMTIEKYNKIINLVKDLNKYVDKIEHIECKRDIEESERTDDGTRYTIDDVFNEIEKENQDECNCK